MKRKMKQILAMVLALVLVLSLAGCGKDAGKDNIKYTAGQADPDPTPTTVPEKDEEEDTAEEVTPEPEEVTYDFGGVTVKVFGSAWNNVDSTDDIVRVEAKTFVEEKYNIKLELAQMEGYDGYNDDDILIASIAAGDPAAHIINLNPESMVTSYLNDILFDLTDYLDLLQVGSIYTDVASWKGRVYGVAYENIGDAWTLVYDRNYLKELGMEKTPTDMFMEGKWDYENAKAYLAELQSKLPDGKYAIGQYPFHWGVMAAAANGSYIFNSDGKIGYMDEALIEAAEFYRELMDSGIAFPSYLIRDAEGKVTENDIAYAVDDERIVLKRAEPWQLGGLGFEYGIVFWPWGSNVTCTGDYTTLSDNYRVAGAYWGMDAVVKAAVDKTGIPGEVLALIAQDYQYAISDDGKEWMHQAYQDEQSGVQTNIGAEFGEPRSFYTEQDIELYDWAHGRYKADLGWSLDSAGLMKVWRPFQDIYMENTDARSTLASYYNEAQASLQEVGLVK